MKRYLLPALLLTFLLAANVAASTLFGRVVEVNDGDVITVFNLNRPVRIKLLAVDAPEAAQDFGEVAKKHLSDLVYDKSVLVEYWGIAADGSLIGRVALNSTDVGAQMIRDGAAWFDASNQGRLSAADRELYRQSEQAARSERRGLWRAENPIAPWEFVRAGALRRSPVASLNAVLPAATVKHAAPATELTNLTLIAGRTATPPPAPAKESDADSAWAMEGPRKNWQQFKPEGENFSALVPEEGKQLKIPVPFGDQMIDVKVYMARDGMAFYSLMWITGPSSGETDKASLNGTVLGFLNGVGQGYQGGAPFSCELEGEKDVSVGGYTGSEFDLPSCTIPAKMRVFTKVVGDQRQMYVGAVFYAEEDPNVSRFLKSFTVGRPHKKQAAKTGRTRSQ